MAFNSAIVDATRDLVCAYKPNVGFYEARGSEGIRELERTIAHIRDVAPSVVVLVDGKRGDIGSTNAAYAKALFETWGADAATINGYAGGADIGPFLAYEGKAVFVWCRSSNEGAAELQDLPVQSNGVTLPFYQALAQRKAVEWGPKGSVGLVVGATYPKELAEVRAIAPDVPILLPGVGAQEGSLRASVEAGVDRSGRNLLVSSSRGVLYASSDPACLCGCGQKSRGELAGQLSTPCSKTGAIHGRRLPYGRAAGAAEEASVRRVRVGGDANGGGHRDSVPDVLTSRDDGAVHAGEAHEGPSVG